MSKKQLREDLFLLLGGIISMLILGAVLFNYLEGWGMVNSFYFVTMTATTVGYGDYTPSTQFSKIATIVYALSIVPFILYAFSFIAKSQMERVYHKIHHLEKKQKLQEQEIDSTERKLRNQKGKIKQQEEELDHQEKHIKKSIKAIKKTEEELETQKNKLNKEHLINKKQANEISEYEKELAVVEKIMEKELKK